MQFRTESCLCWITPSAEEISAVHHIQVKTANCIPHHLLTQIHNMVSANGTVINHNVPSPQSYCVPLERKGKKKKRNIILTQFSAHRNPCYSSRSHVFLLMEKLGYLKKKSYKSRVILHREFRLLEGSGTFLSHTSQTKHLLPASERR